MLSLTWHLETVVVVELLSLPYTAVVWWPVPCSTGFQIQLGSIRLPRWCLCVLPSSLAFRSIIWFYSLVFKNGYSMWLHSCFCRLRSLSLSLVLRSWVSVWWHKVVCKILNLWSSKERKWQKSLSSMILGSFYFLFHQCIINAALAHSFPAWLLFVILSSVYVCPQITSLKLTTTNVFIFSDNRSNSGKCYWCTDACGAVFILSSILVLQ